MRVTGKDYGVKGIWAFENEEVNDKGENPWNDGAEYGVFLHFSPLIREFTMRFSENFTGKPIKDGRKY